LIFRQRVLRLREHKKQLLGILGKVANRQDIFSADGTVGEVHGLDPSKNVRK
jgi:hypothetical protein